jgi:hypothetical protein
MIKDESLRPMRKHCLLCRQPCVRERARCERCIGAVTVTLCEPRADRDVNWPILLRNFQMSRAYAGDSTSVKPNLVAFLRNAALSRSRVRRSYAAALRSR